MKERNSSFRCLEFEVCETFLNFRTSNSLRWRITFFCFQFCSLMNLNESSFGVTNPILEKLLTMVMLAFKGRAAESKHFSSYFQIP